MDSLTVVTNSASSIDYALIISIITFIGGVFMFWRYDKRLKSQEEKINAYQIRKNEQEEQDSKRAYIEANITKGVRAGARTLKIYNKGNAPARNINMEIIGNYPNIIWSLDGLFPHSKLNKHQGLDISFTYFKYMGESPQKLKVKFMWDDDFQCGNEDIQEYPF